MNMHVCIILLDCQWLSFNVDAYACCFLVCFFPIISKTAQFIFFQIFYHYQIIHPSLLMHWYHQDVIKVNNNKKGEEVELGYDQQLTPNSLRRG